ncbi:unnamed protein product, partial [Ectocarpus sp. 12 AP-2014]
ANDPDRSLPTEARGSLNVWTTGGISDGRESDHIAYRLALMDSVHTCTPHDSVFSTAHSLPDGSEHYATVDTCVARRGSRIGQCWLPRKHKATKVSSRLPTPLWAYTMVSLLWGSASFRL